ncbi:MAG: 3'(2'),5'-bisphosphate nucleotidase CysQ [Bernardetiaceae bacterium]|nr:3'(2'),5'-bisphosphate nucleotidase CysQ [Bernardetiaceae bacterium]
MQAHIDKLNQIAREAGKAILEVYHNHTDFSDITDRKADSSPVTLADKKAHIIIENGLLAIDAHIPLLSEEGSIAAYSERKTWTKYWIVDPLDGTKEFLKRNGNFTVNIALIENQKTVLGVIYAPYYDALYYGTAGEAYKIEGGKEERIYVANKPATAPLKAFISRSHYADEDLNLLKPYDLSETEKLGSSLKFCKVAEGKADLYFRSKPTMEWDTAAGQAIVEAAGGKMYDANGKHFLYNKPNLENGKFRCYGIRI